MQLLRYNFIKQHDMIIIILQLIWIEHLVKPNYMNTYFHNRQMHLTLYDKKKGHTKSNIIDLNKLFP